jgi:AbrB family looped-hinge helix DNA binding protein
LIEVIATEKGQIVIPAAVRRKLGIKEGTHIQVEVDEQNHLIILRPMTREHIRALRGKYKSLELLKALNEDKKRERRL